MKRRATKNARTQPGDKGLHPADEDRASITDKLYYKEMHRFEQSWHDGSIHALADALIACHKEKAELPLWLVQGALYCLKLLFEGKTLPGKGRLARATTRHHSALIDYHRWDQVKELEDRRDEILSYCLQLSAAERENRPEFFNLTKDYSVEQRCAAVSELLALLNSPAKGSPSTIHRSYKNVEKDMKNGKTSKYYMPGLQNPLSDSSILK